MTLIFTLISLFFIQTGASVDRPKSLDRSDFVVAGVADSADLFRVHEILGSPERIDTSPNPFDRESRITTWHFPGLAVCSVDGKAVHGISITDKRWRTARGLAIGDSRARMIELYGKPDDEYDGSFYYRDPADRSELHVIQVTSEADRVKSIFVGWLLD